MPCLQTPGMRLLKLPPASGVVEQYGELDGELQEGRTQDNEERSGLSFTVHSGGGSLGCLSTMVFSTYAEGSPRRRSPSGRSWSLHCK